MTANGGFGEFKPPASALPQDDGSQIRLRELRMFLERLCSDLCRFKHIAEEDVPPESIKIRQEVNLGIPGAFADIAVEVPGLHSYFVEIKYGYGRHELANLIARKYGTRTPVTSQASKVVLVIELVAADDGEACIAELRAKLHPGLTLEVWDEPSLCRLIRKYFKVEVESISESNAAEIKTAIEHVKGVQAFGDEFRHEPLQMSLMWHFSFWELRRFRDSVASARDMLPPGFYPRVVTVFADLCSFSSYLRDTRDGEVVRQVLTSFYSKAGQQITDCGGMLYQFLGDGVVALFGVPLSQPGYFSSALDCGKALLDIGESISLQWQRRIDHLQSAHGCHVGIGFGDLHIMPLRPFGRHHFGVIADSVNMASRLASAASAGEIVVSNIFFEGLSENEQGEFVETPPIEAHNMGLLKAWKYKRMER